MVINFRLNKKNDGELISLLNKYKNNNNMSEFIRGILRDSLLTSKSISNNDVEDPFVTASNTDNVVEIRQVNKKTEINNTSNINSKKESIKWNFPS